MGLPSTLSDGVVPPEFFTWITYVAPRQRRSTVNSPISFGRHGLTTSPSHSGRTPSRYWLTATKFHAAVPVSQLFFASPWRTASLPAIICAYTYGSSRWISLISSRYAGAIFL